MGYEFLSRIRYSECDQHEKLTLEHLADYFQDCTVFHDAEVGLGMHYWAQKHQMWVLTSWKILIFRRPICGEMVKVRTDAILCKGFKGLRNFTLRDENGHMLAAAFSKWALLDTLTGRPVRILPEEGDAYGRTEPLPIDTDNGRIEVPEEAASLDPIEIQVHHLDSNRHVNNAQYIRMVEGCLPKGFEVRSMRVSYHRSAALGDTIYPKISVSEHQVTGVLADAQGEPYVYFEFLDSVSENDAKVETL